MHAWLEHLISFDSVLLVTLENQVNNEPEARQ